MHNYEIIRETVFMLIGERRWRNSQIKITLELNETIVTITDSQVILQKRNSKKDSQKIDTKVFCEDAYNLIRNYEEN